MKRDDVHRIYLSQTTKASDTARNLAFAGLGTIWLFHVEGTVGAIVPLALYPAAVLFSLALLFDMLQYSVAAIRWTRWNFHVESEARDHKRDDQFASGISSPQTHGEHDYGPSTTIHRWPRNFFYCKISVVIIGYISLLAGVGRLAYVRLQPTPDPWLCRWDAATARTVCGTAR